jgi:ribosomal protein L31
LSEDDEGMKNNNNNTGMKVRSKSRKSRQPSATLLFFLTINAKIDSQQHPFFLGYARKVINSFTLFPKNHPGVCFQ